jgi:ammonia channel protein AmtB
MINGANTGFMLLATSLVMLMTPGLAFFYGGLVGRSNTLTIIVTPVRVGTEAERGLDAAMHGESAYQLNQDVPRGEPAV